MHGTVTCCPYFREIGLQIFIHSNTCRRHPYSSLSGKLSIWNQTDTGSHLRELQASPAEQLQLVSTRDPLYGLNTHTGLDTHSELAQIIAQLLAKGCRQQAATWPRTSAEQRHAGTALCHHCGQFRTDQSRTNDANFATRISQYTGTPIIGQRAIVNDVRIITREAPRLSTNGKQHFFIAIQLTLLVANQSSHRINLYCTAPKVHLDLTTTRRAPDFLQPEASPQRL